MVSARMKPFSKSEWISPAAFGALAPLCTVHARASLGPDGEEGEQVEQLVAGADHAGEAGFVQAQLFEIFDAFLISMPTSSASIAAETTTACAPSALALSRTPGGIGVAARRAFFLDIADIEHGLGRQQLRLFEHARFLLVIGHDQPRGLALAQQIQRLPQHEARACFPCRLRRLFLRRRARAFRGFRGRRASARSRPSRHPKSDRLCCRHAGCRRSRSSAAHGRWRPLADVAEELVAQPFALARAAHQPGDVDEAELGRDDLLAARNLRELVSRGSGTATLPTFGSIVQKG
jgi:hypothetical protein